MINPDNYALRLRITGEVQGVGYRAWFAREAEAAGLYGWVRNRLDGSVEALISGPAATVSEMAARAWTGSAASRVQQVETAAAEGIVASRFIILPSV